MNTTIAVIEFGTSKIVTVIARSGGSNKCEILGTGTEVYNGFLPEGWNEPDELNEKVRKAINTAQEEAGMKISEIYIGVPGEFLSVRSGEAEIDLGNGENEIDEEVMNTVQDCVADRLQIVQLGGVVLHRSPAWFSVDGARQTMNPLGMRGRKLAASTSFIIADPGFIHDMKQLFRDIGITINGFLSSTLGEALLLLSPDERDRSGVLIDSGYLSTEVSVVKGDAILFHEVIPIGGGHITAEIAEDMRLPMRASEQLKRKYIFNADDFDKNEKTEIRGPEGRKISFTHDEVAPACERQMKILCEAINECIRQRAASSMDARCQVFLTGGGISMMRGTKDYLSNVLGKPVRMPGVKSAKMNSPVFASTMGLIDLIFDSIGQAEEDEGGFIGFLKKKPLLKRG